MVAIKENHHDDHDHDHWSLTRIGNLLVPNNNYVKFEEWLMPILDKLLEE